MISYFWRIYFLFNVIHGLRWKSSEHESNNDMIISLGSSKPNISIDLHQKEQIVILRDLNSFTSPIQIYCFITGYNEKSDITFYFCKESDRCIKQKDNIIAQTFHDFNMNIRMRTKFENRKGMIVEIKLPSGDNDVSGSFHCKVEQEYFSIRTNNVQIRDTIYWAENLITNEENTKTIITNVVNKDELPRVFNCNSGFNYNPNKPDWIDQEFISPVLWSICPVKKNYDSLSVQERMTFEICKQFTLSKWQDPDATLEPKDINRMRSWKSYVNRQGELIIFDITQQPETSFALMCYRKKNNKVYPINTYVTEYRDDLIVKGVEFKTNNANPNSPLVSKSATLTHVDIYARKIWPSIEMSKMEISIYAKYSAPNTAKWEWLYNGKELHKTASMDFNKYKVTFKRDIKSDLAGNYTLSVKDKSRTLSISKIVAVLGPPTISDPQCLPPFIYVKENENVSLICNYGNDPVERSFQINGLDIKSNDAHSRSGLQKSYAHLANLSFSISAVNSSKVWTMTYNASRLTISEKQIKYQDHSVTFQVKNKFGISIRSTTIYVVPSVKNQIPEFPRALNCTPFCQSSDNHRFTCHFNQDKYQNKELIIDHYWTINYHRIGRNGSYDILEYFKMDPKNKDLELKKINSSDSQRDARVKALLKSTSLLVCHIELRNNLYSTSKFEYDSSLDSEIANKLVIKLMFDKQPNSAFVTWIIIAIAVLLLLIIIIVVIYNRSRSQGDTYLLEKLEEKHGHDRDKELEKQKFKPYQYKNKHEDGDSIHSDVELNNYETLDCVA